MYFSAWKYGLKSTYYCRSKGATSTEKSTITDHNLNRVKVCNIDDPGCESCQ